MPMQTILTNYQIDVNDGIIAVGDIPQQPPHASLIVNDTDNNNVLGSDDNNNNAERDSNDGSDNKDKKLSGEDNDNKPPDSAAATNADDNESGSNQGVQRSQRRGKGIAKKYADYSLLMAARQAKRGGAHWALIHDGCIFFSADNLSIAKPIPEEDREEFVLGVALAHYLMNAGIKKFKANGQSRSDQGAHSDAGLGAELIKNYSSFEKYVKKVPRGFS
jgi:hypothetical protein